jgi:site-specific DNA-cytosine methylase
MNSYGVGKNMRYVSVYSGIEAASVAWEPLGFMPVSFAEIEAFPSAVLAHHWPDGPRYKALGNSMAVPVMRWIGERIRKYETANYNA